VLNQVNIANGDKLDVHLGPYAARARERVSDHHGEASFLCFLPSPVGGREREKRESPPSGPGVRLDSLSCDSVS